MPLISSIFGATAARPLHSQPSIRHFIPHAQADITDTRSAPPSTSLELLASSFQKVETFVTTLSRSSGLALAGLKWMIGDKGMSFP